MTWMPVAQSALHYKFLYHGARLETRGHWQVPATFSGVDIEVAAARNGVVVGERGGAGIVDVVGADVDKTAKRLGVDKVAPGAVVSVNGAKGLPAGARWARLTRQQARVLVGTGEAGAVVEALKAKDGCLHAKDITSGLTTLSLVGPKSPDLLARVVRLDLDPRGFENQRLALTGSVGIPLQIIRWDINSVLAYELTVGRDLAEYYWDSLEHAGEDMELKFIGADALAQLGAVS